MRTSRRRLAPAATHPRLLVLMRLGGLGLLLSMVAACAALRTPDPEALRVVATPHPTGYATVAVELPTPSPSPSPTPQPVPQPPPVSDPPPLAAPLPPPPPPEGIEAFRGLGAWMDVFDHDDRPETILPAVHDMADRGVRTLYLETARAPSTDDIDFPTAVGEAIDAAKERGMYVVAWYPPAFDDLERDVRRSVAAIEFTSPGGNRFDAFGADIEVTAAVPDHAERNRRTIEYTQRIRNAAGPSYPMAAIVIPPTHLERSPNRWPDFPWEQLSPHYQVFMPMNYWTGIGRDPDTAREQTELNLSETQRLSGRPVHIIGGLANGMDVPSTAAFVDAAKAGGSIGGSVYDYRITPQEMWGELRRLND